MNWKQPIDTGIYEEFGSDIAVLNLFIHIMLHAQTEDMEKPAFYKGKPYQLKRGQFIFGRNQYAEYINLSPSGTDRALSRLTEVYSKVTCKRSKNFSIGTILNYDELVKMDKQSNKQVTSKSPESNTPKNERSIISKEIIQAITSFGFSEKVSEGLLGYLEIYKKKFKVGKTVAEVEKLCKKIQDGYQKLGVSEASMIESIRRATDSRWSSIFPKQWEEAEIQKEVKRPIPQSLEIWNCVNRYARKGWSNNEKNKLHKWVEEYAKKERNIPDPPAVDAFINEHILP